MKLVLAATIQNHDWDGRYSHDNKAWAKTVEIPGDRDIVIRDTHPGLINLLVTHVREKTPSVIEKLRQPSEKSKSAPPKKPEISI